MWHGYARELVRLELMKSSAVYTTLPEKLVGRNGIERLPDAADEARIARDGAGKDWCRIHGKVNVGHSRARVIQDEAKRSPAFGIARPDISADDRRRAALPDLSSVNLHDRAQEGEGVLSGPLEGVAADDRAEPAAVADGARLVVHGLIVSLQGAS